MRRAQPAQAVLVFMSMLVPLLAESEVWERLAQLESKLAQQHSHFQQQLAAVQAHVRVLEADNRELRRSGSMGGTIVSNVNALGDVQVEGRRLSPASCCRWTPGSYCNTVSQECTRLHEYLEQKTTTHEFVDLATCMTGNDHTKWSASFDGASGNVSLSNDGTVVATTTSPLKVTHASNCASSQPTLTLQMDTTAAKTLTVGGLDVGAQLARLPTYSLSSLSKAGTATQSSYYADVTYGDSTGDLAFDGLTTSWHSYTTGVPNDPEWLQLQLTTPSTVVAYSIMTRSGVNANCDAPHKWTLQGSNDGSTWVDLHSVSGECDWFSNEVRMYYLPPGAPASYGYLKWSFPGAAVGAAGGCGCTDTTRDFVVIEEISLFGSA